MANKSKAKGDRAENLVMELTGFHRLGAAKAALGYTDGQSRDSNVWLEVKAGNTQLPALLIRAFAQCQRNKTDNQVGVVALVPDGVGKVKGPDEIIMCLPLKEFMRLYHNNFGSDIAEITVTYNNGKKKVYSLPEVEG